VLALVAAYMVVLAFIESGGVCENDIECGSDSCCNSVPCCSAEAEATGPETTAPAAALAAVGESTTGNGWSSASVIAATWCVAELELTVTEDCAGREPSCEALRRRGTELMSSIHCANEDARKCLQ